MNKYANHIFATGAEADKVLYDMSQLLKCLGYVKALTFSEWINSKTTENEKYIGWTSFDGVKVVERLPKTKNDVSNGISSGYTISLPDPMPINKLINIWSTIKQDAIKGIGKEIDVINHPTHYQSETGLEVIDVVEAFTFDLNGIEATDTGNIIKYICRWKKKNGIEDLEKIIWYTQHLINHVKKMNEENK